MAFGAKFGRQVRVARYVPWRNVKLPLVPFEPNAGCIEVLGHDANASQAISDVHRIPFGTAVKCICFCTLLVRNFIICAVGWLINCQHQSTDARPRGACHPLKRDWVTGCFALCADRHIVAAFSVGSGSWTFFYPCGSKREGCFALDRRLGWPSCCQVRLTAICYWFCTHKSSYVERFLAIGTALRRLDSFIDELRRGYDFFDFETEPINHLILQY